MVLTPNIKLAATVLVVAGLYAVTLPTGITFEDAGLFQQVCHYGGIAHPPGYPLFTLACSPLYKLGLDPVITGNLISVFFALCTLVVLFFILRMFSVSDNIACTSILLFAVSLEFWSQAIIIEVYTLNTFLAATLLWCCLRFRDDPTPRVAFAIALTFGLALSNHWPLTIATAPGLAMLVLAKWRVVLSYLGRVDCIALVFSGLLLGLLPYAVMFTKPDDVYGYSGHIEDLEALVRYLSRDSYSAVDTSSYSGTGDKLAFTAWFGTQLLVQFGWFFGLVGLFGLYQGIKENPWVHSGLLAILAGNSLVLIALLGFEFTFPYCTAFSHYPLVAYLCWSIWLGIGLQRGLTFVRARATLYRYAAIAVLLAASGSMLFVNYRQNDRSNDVLAADYANLILMTLPENSALIVDSDAQLGSIGFTRHVRNVRPDIDLFEADNVFTFKRLPADQKERQAFVLELSKTRPVFAIEAPWLPTRAEHGLFQEIGTPVSDQFAGEPDHLPFLQSVAARYMEGSFRTPGNLGFAHQILIGAGHHLFGRARSGLAEPDEIETLIFVQQTFPGAIGIVSTALTTGKGNLNDSALLTLLAPFEDKFPISALPAEIAQYYTMMSVLSHEDPEKSETLLQQAADALPDSRNPAFCHLHPQAGTCAGKPD